MPLSPSAPREHLHTRTVECRGYRRSDGLWDIEGRLRDSKTYSFTSEHRGELEVGEPVHDMSIRLTVDDRLVIHAVEAATDASPYRVCPDVVPNFQRLRGLRIGRGFHGKVKELLGGTAGCTHLVELLGPVATTAFQTIFPVKLRDAPRAARGVPPYLLDTCHALARDGEIAGPSSAEPVAGA